MIDLLAIFKAITPENIQELPLVRVAMEIFANELSKHAQVAQRISAIYDDFNEDDDDMDMSSKYNLKTGLYLLYTNTLYTACSKLSQDPEVKKTLEKFNYTDAAIQNDLNVLINSEFLNSQRAFSQTVGTEKALHYMYSFAKYLETGAVRDDLEISTRDPFIMHYEGSLNKRTFETVVYPLAHPLGWAYSYYTVITQVLRDYYGITLIYNVKKLWLVNNAEGKYVVFTDKSLDEVYEEFRNMINPLTQTFFTDDEIARNVQVYTDRRVIDYQRWEDEKGNWCQLFTFDDDMVLYHDGTKGTTTYTSYEDYIDGCKEPQNVWNRDYAIVADMVQDVKFEYFDTYDLEKTFNITRIRDTDHKVGDSEYMSDDITRAFGVSGRKYLYNKGVDESRHILVKSNDGTPVGGYWLPHHNTFDERLRHLEILAYRLYEQDVEFNGEVYNVVAYDDEMFVPELDKPISERLKKIEDSILPLTFITTPRGDDSIELLTANGSNRPTSDDVYERVDRLESIINEIRDVVVEYKGYKYKVLTRLYQEKPYKLSFEQDYIGNIKIYGSDLLEVDDNVKDIQEYEFDTKDYHGNVIKVELTDLLGQKIIVETDTLNRDASLYITKCKLSTYGDYYTTKYKGTDLETSIVPTDIKGVQKFGLTVYGRYTKNANDDPFIYDVQTFDNVTFSDSVETIYLELEDEEGRVITGTARTDIVGNFMYTFDTSELSGDMNSGRHNFKASAYTMNGTKRQNETYYKGNWLNDFDKTPTYITLPIFHKIHTNFDSYELKDIKTSQMVGIDNVDVDFNMLSDTEKELATQNRIKVVEEVKGDGDDLEIVSKTLYRNYDYIGEKTTGYYEPDKWAPDFFDKSLNDGAGGYLPYTGFISGNIIEGENYAKSTWEYYPEEEVFVGMGYRKHLIDTSDFYIMDSTRFCHDDFEISSVGDDYYLYSLDSLYLNTIDDEYLVTDEDDKLTDAWGIKTEDGMTKDEWGTLYTLNGVVLKDFTTFENTLVPSKRYIDAYGDNFNDYDYIDVKIVNMNNIIGKEVTFECIGDGLFEGDPEMNNPTELPSTYVSKTKAVIQSDGTATVRVYSHEPFSQSLLVRASYDIDVTVPDIIEQPKGDYLEDGTQVTIPQTYHTETRTFKHDCYILYKVTEYILKVDTPPYITPDGYTLKYYNLLPGSPVVEKEPLIITGVVKDDYSFDAVHKPFTSKELEVTHVVRYYSKGTRQDEYAFTIPYVDLHFTGDRDIINAFDPEYRHITKLGYAYATITGCRAGEKLTFTALGDCELADVPEHADRFGNATVKVISKEPFVEDPGVRVLTHQFDIEKEVHFTYNSREIFPVLTLPTLTNIYGTFENTIDTDTDYVIHVDELLCGSIVSLMDGDTVLQSKITADGFVDFICKGVDYHTKSKEITVKYRVNGSSYDNIIGNLSVYQYVLSTTKALSKAGKNGIDAFNGHIATMDTKEITVHGGKPLYQLQSEIKGDGRLTGANFFDARGNAVLKVSSQDPWFKDIEVSATSQGQSTTATVPYELSVYDIQIDCGNLDPDIYYAPSLVQYRGVSGVSVTDTEVKTQESGADYNTSYEFKYTGFKPNKNVQVSVNNKVTTVKADNSGNITFVTDKIDDYDVKNLVIEITYECMGANTSTSVLNTIINLGQYDVTATSSVDVVEPGGHSTVTFSGLRNGETCTYNVSGCGEIVSSDKVVTNGKCTCVIRSVSPFVGNIVLTCTILKSCSGVSNTTASVNLTLSKSVEIIENDGTCVVTLSGGENGKEVSWSVSGDVDIVSKGSKFDNGKCTCTIKGKAPYLNKAEILVQSYGAELSEEVPLIYTVQGYRSDKVAFGAGKIDSEKGKVYPSSEIYLGYDINSNTITLKNHPEYGSAFECIEPSKVYYYYESIPVKTWVPPVYKTVSYGYGYGNRTYQVLVREGYYKTTYTNERRTNIIKGKFKRV